MGTIYINDYIARILVEEKLNYPRREPVILDNFHPWRTIRDAAAVIATVTRRFAKSVNRGLHRWVDTQSACIPLVDPSMANC